MTTRDAVEVTGLFIIGCAVLAWLAWYFGSRDWRSNDVAKGADVRSLAELQARKDVR